MAKKETVPEESKVKETTPLVQSQPLDENVKVSEAGDSGVKVTSVEPVKEDK